MGEQVADFHPEYDLSKKILSLVIYQQEIAMYE